MDKNVARIDPDLSSWAHLPPMQNGRVNSAFFKRLQETYKDRTGYNLVLSDPNGSIQMGLPDCDKFPCMQSCRECRESIVMEALRTQKVCIDTCHEGYTIWGLPFASNGKVVGGLIVIGGDSGNFLDEESFRNACAELYSLMSEHGILPKHLAECPSDLSDVHRFLHRGEFDKVFRAVSEHKQAFLHRLQTADHAEANVHLERIRDSLRSSANLPMDLVCGLVGDLIFDAKRQCIQSGMDTYACTAEAGALIEQVASISDMEGIDAVLNAFQQRFTALASHKTKDQDDLVVEKATTFMEEHIRESLTRETVSKAVGISPSHFSRLIRDKKGRTFTDLLNQYRIEHAAKLLVRSSYTLAHIASESGFCDQSYFSKVFRKYKNMSPAEYRDSHSG